MKNKKILIIANTTRFIKHFLVPIITELTSLGNRVDIVSSGSADFDFCDNYYDFNMSRSPISLRNISAYHSIKDLMKKESYDLVYVHTPVGSVLPRIAKMFNRDLRNTKLVYMAHGFHFYKGAPIVNWLSYYPIERYLSKYADGLLLINKEDYRFAIKHKFASKIIEYIPGVGINLERFKNIDDKQKNKIYSDLGLQQTDFILTFVAELNQNKNQTLLFDTIGLLKSSIPNIKLVLAGDGVSMDKYKQYVIDHNLSDYVIFVGYTTLVPEILSITDVSVSSSIREGLPVNLLESMASGKPLVVTNCRGNRDLAINNENGFVVDFNAEEFSNAIEKIYKDRDLYESMSNKSLEFVEQYSVENVNSKVLALIEDVIDNEQN